MGMLNIIKGTMMIAFVITMFLFVEIFIGVIATVVVTTISIMSLLKLFLLVFVGVIVLLVTGGAISWLNDEYF